jgi:hypothetical protein
MSIKSEILYGAVRKTGGKLQVDINTLYYTPQITKEKADQIDSQLPLWKKDNPVIKIAQFKLTEIK